LHLSQVVGVRNNTSDGDIEMADGEYEQSLTRTNHFTRSTLSTPPLFPFSKNAGNKQMSDCSVLEAAESSKKSGGAKGTEYFVGPQALSVRRDNTEVKSAFSQGLSEQLV
jgi:hypothetical protein